MNEQNNAIGHVPGSEPAPQALIDAVKRTMLAETRFSQTIIARSTTLGPQGPQLNIDFAQMLATQSSNALLLQFLLRTLADEFGLDLAGFYEGLASEFERQTELMKSAKANAPKILVPR